MFAAFEVGYQPVAVFVVDGVEVNRWLGSFSEEELRQAFETATA